MHFDKLDKKLLARARDQYAYETDVFGDRHFIGYRCRNCNKVFTRLTDFEVDHIKPRSKAGSDKPGNLQLLCKSCNRRKSDKPWRQITTAKTKTTTTKTKTTTAKRKTTTAKKTLTPVTRRATTAKKTPHTAKTQSSTAKVSRR